MEHGTKYLFLLFVVLALTGCSDTDEPERYRVYYDGNGSTSGTPPRDSNQYSWGQNVRVLGKGDLKKDNYTFLGWRLYSGDSIYYEGNYITINRDINLYAVWDDGIDNAFSFKIEEDEVIITKYNKVSKSVTIPQTLQSKPVTAISDENVFSSSNIESVDLGKNLKKIGTAAFAYNNITQIIIPDSVEFIGLCAFQNNKLTRINFGSGLDTIGPYVFQNNNLVIITIPETIRNIKTGAFHGNKIELIKIGADVNIENDTALGTYGASFKEYYDDQGKQAGYYIYNNTDWDME